MCCVYNIQRLTQRISFYWCLLLTGEGIRICYFFNVHFLLKEILKGQNKIIPCFTLKAVLGVYNFLFSDEYIRSYNTIYLCSSKHNKGSKWRIRFWSFKKLHPSSKNCSTWLHCVNKGFLKRINLRHACIISRKVILSVDSRRITEVRHC